MKKSLIAAALMLGIAALAYADNPAGTVVGSAHDLSVGTASTYINGELATGAVTGQTGQICVFCHTPHNAGDTKLPLWSHALTQQNNFTAYYNADFSTIAGAQPGAVSKACLGCHDGSVALGYVANGAFRSADATGTGDLANGVHGIRDDSGATIALGDDMNIGGNADLSTTHPIGIAYPGVVAGQFKDVASNTAVKLFKEGGASATQIECASCHEPHNQGAQEGRFFLRSTNDNSALCLTCHIK